MILLGFLGQVNSEPFLEISLAHLGRELVQSFKVSLYKRRYPNDWWICEKVFNIISHRENGDKTRERYTTVQPTEC